MPRTARLAPGGYVFHVLNRGNGRATIFDDDGDYAAFERVLFETLELERRRGRPFGAETWQARAAELLGLLASLRPRGRPRKATGPTQPKAI